MSQPQKPTIHNNSAHLQVSATVGLTKNLQYYHPPPPPCCKLRGSGGQQVASVILTTLWVHGRDETGTWHFGPLALIRPHQRQLFFFLWLFRMVHVFAAKVVSKERSKRTARGMTGIETNTAARTLHVAGKSPEGKADYSCICLWYAIIKGQPSAAILNQFARKQTSWNSVKCNSSMYRAGQNATFFFF